MADAVGIVCHPRIDLGGPAVMDAQRQLQERGFRVWTYCATPEERPGALEANLDGTRLIVSIGGDGTLLWTAQQAATAHIPVLGINAGRLGFLTQVQVGEEGQALDRWAAGDFTLRRHALLEARVDDQAVPSLSRRFCDRDAHPKASANVGDHIVELAVALVVHDHGGDGASGR